MNDIFTKQEIKKYKAEDQLSACKTQFVETGDSTSTLYLSSAYTKTIAALGSVASTIIGGLIGGSVGGSIGAFLSSIASANIDTNKGIYIFQSTKRCNGTIRSCGSKMGVPVRVI